jgi:hypothetical protein
VPPPKRQYRPPTPPKVSLLVDSLSEEVKRGLFDRKSRWTSEENQYAEQVMALFSEGKLFVKVTEPSPRCRRAHTHLAL